ncbi:hypothetical protein RF11_06540 [Thelohanellus kitauei]|uniref:Uncharacterized protein n=1 Tax=Thelohanellus kitauei TaxID=669202 RepID=A0A0C2IW89_THEKT|nr:hypothetical protein RF11_06540 [Thelohanellus kitauei]
MLTASIKLITSQIYLPSCKGNDDTIMMYAAIEADLMNVPFCAPADDPYNDDHYISHIRGDISYNSSDLFEKWFRDVVSKQIFDLDKCFMKKDENILTIQGFIDYLKNQRIPKENYTRMMISAQCYLQSAVNDFYQVKPTFESKNEFDQ